MIFQAQVSITIDASSEDDARDKIHTALSGMDSEIVDIEEDIEEEPEEEEEEVGE